MQWILQTVAGLNRLNRVGFKQSWVVSLISLIALSGLLAACDEAPATSSPTPSSTPFPFVTATNRPTATSTGTSTATVSPTRTDITPTVSVSSTLIIPTLNTDRTTTPIATAIGICVGPPLDVFGQVYEQDPGLQPAIGCTTAPPDSSEAPQIWVVEITYQSFERGYMLRASNVGWSEAPVIYALFDDGTYIQLDDMFDPSNSSTFPTPTAPDGRLVPSGAIYKVWNEVAGLRTKIGFATANPIIERFGQMQMFEYGEMYYISPLSEVYAFRRGSINSWASYLVMP